MAVVVLGNVALIGRWLMFDVATAAADVAVVDDEAGDVL